MAIDINIAIFLSISILVIGLLGLLNKSSLFALFPFIGAVMGFIFYNYLAADGQIAVNGTNYSDYPFILVPLFLAICDLGLCAYKAGPTSKIIESIFLGVGLLGIDAYFVPNVLVGFATTVDVNLPPAMVGFIQGYGEVTLIGVSLILAVYWLYSIWFK